MLDLESLVEEQLPLLKSVESSWQPADFLPDMAREDWAGQVEELRRQAALLPDGLLVCLVGNIVTEEALPSYQTWLNRAGISRDDTGTGTSPWAVWTRGWTAEENRHGDLLSRYLFLCGRVDFRSFEVTVQHLIRNGFDTQSGADPYRSLVYVSFQERATKICHANMGRLAEKSGSAQLAKICAVIAADEARHEEAYKRFFKRIVERDPSAAVIAFMDMMDKRIAMPARLMSDGTGDDLFDRFAITAQRTGMYTFQDYADILKHLIEFWNIGSLGGLTGRAAQSQDALCRLPEKYTSKVERVREVIARAPEEPFTWIFGRTA